MFIFLLAAFIGYMLKDDVFFFQYFMWGGIIGFVLELLPRIKNVTAGRKEKRAAKRAERRERKSEDRSAVGLFVSKPKPEPKTARFKTPAEPLKLWPICREMLEQSHLLVGGTTGSGKSTLAHSIIWTLSANNPLAASFYGIDLKRVELARWQNLPHCHGIAKDPKAALEMIEKVNGIVDARLGIMERNGQTKYLGGDVYLIVDELAELLAVNRKAVVDGLSRIMRLGRAAKVHVFGFTQAPNRSKGGGLDPLLCQNFTAAVALRCRSAIESRQIVGVAGAEELPQNGYGIFWSASGTRDILIPMTSDRAIAERVSAWTA